MCIAQGTLIGRAAFLPPPKDSGVSSAEIYELYCSMECLNHCEKITVNNISCADSQCYWEDEPSDNIEPPTEKQINFVKTICEYMPWIEMPELETKFAAFHWLQTHVPKYKEQKAEDIRQKFI